MITILLTALAGVLFLVGTSFLLEWMNEEIKKRSRKRTSDKYKYFDDNFNFVDEK